MANIAWLWRILAGRRSRESNAALPDSMLAEVDRLGEDRSLLERLAESEGLEFARSLLGDLSTASELFDKWYPRLTQFASAKRGLLPLPADDALTSSEKAARRILHPKIVNAERVPARNHFTAALSSAPLSVLPLVMAEWPSMYRNAVFLTPEETAEWHGQYDEPSDAPWWCVFQSWDFECFPWDELSGLDPSRMPGTFPLLITEGLAWGCLAGGGRSEWWASGPDGESLITIANDTTF